MAEKIEQSKDPKRGSSGGKIGGKWKGPKGFAVSGKASEAGKIGGKKSKRGRTMPVSSTYSVIDAKESPSKISRGHEDHRTSFFEKA